VTQGVPGDNGTRSRDDIAVRMHSEPWPAALVLLAQDFKSSGEEFGRFFHELASGGGGIRTHGTAKRYTGFRDRPYQPLRHPSVISVIQQIVYEKPCVPGRIL
jgi:hypothetical protein